MRRSILVLGRTGMLGQACVRRLQAMPGWTIEGTQRVDPGGGSYVDVSTSFDDLERALAVRPWGYVVNAIGVLSTLVDPQDTESARRAIRINALLPYEIATIAGRHGVRVIHISSDAVFGRTSDEPYTETSPTAPSDFYGNTKALGECRAANVLNLRCSIIGRDPHHGRGLVEWLLAFPPGSTAKGFIDYTWSAATTDQVADLCAALITQDAYDGLRSLSSVYHFAPNQPISKYDFLKTLAEVAGRHVIVTPAPSPGGAMRRILQTRFTEFQRLLPEPRPWEAVLASICHDKDTPTQ